MEDKFTSMLDGLVRTEQHGAVRVIVLNRPQRLNAISPALLNTLNTRLAQAMSDDSVRVLVLRGEGRAFCAGDDLLEQIENGDIEESALRQMVGDLQQVTRQLMWGSKPVIGLVHGWAIGGGFSWTLNCDISLWAKSARGKLPEIKFGLFPSGGLTYLLPRAIGRMAAMQAALTGTEFSADELHMCGVAWKVVNDEDLLPTGMALAQSIAELPTKAAGRLKQTFLAADQTSLSTALAMEHKACVDALLDPETLVRIQRFLMERK